MLPTSIRPYCHALAVLVVCFPCQCRLTSLQLAIIGAHLSTMNPWTARSRQRSIRSSRSRLVET